MPNQAYHIAIQGNTKRMNQFPKRRDPKKKHLNFLNLPIQVKPLSFRLFTVKNQFQSEQKRLKRHVHGLFFGCWEELGPVHCHVTNILVCLISHNRGLSSLTSSECELTRRDT